jgi:hypothetical protein
MQPDKTSDNPALQCIDLSQSRAGNLLFSPSDRLEWTQENKRQKSKTGSAWPECNLNQIRFIFCLMSWLHVFSGYVGHNFMESGWDKFSISSRYCWKRSTLKVLVNEPG